MKIAHEHLLVLAAVVMLPPVALAQSIQRCEGASQRVTYSNAECPVGTKPVKSLAPAPQPSAEVQAAAQAKLQRVRDELKTQPSARAQSPAAVSDSAVRKAADCAYLQASIDSSRRLRNILTTRPYYSTEDVDEAGARTKEVTAEYRRVCG